MRATLLIWDTQPILPAYKGYQTQLNLENKTKETYHIVFQFSRALWRQIWERSTLDLTMLSYR